MPTCSCAICRSEDEAGDFGDQPRLVYPASVASPPTVAMTPQQRQEAWRAWRIGKEFQQILQDVASQERSFGDAAEAVFMAGIEAVLKK